jgi:L-ribulose-5-phosphate 4-epimerase
MWEQERKTVLEASKRLQAAGLVAGSQGNISLRFEDGGRQLVAITPSGKDYSFMHPADIVVVDDDGKTVGGSQKPSMETMMPLAVYAKRADATAIIHSHSVYASALAISVDRIPAVLDDQVFYLGGEITVARHALPGSADLARNVAAALGDKNAVLMSNHGALVTGNTMDRAFFNCQLLEKLSQVYIYSRLLGGNKELPAEVIDKEKKMFGGSGTI